MRRILAKELSSLGIPQRNLNQLRERGINNISALLTLHANNIDFIEEIIEEYLRQGFNSDLATLNDTQR